MPSPEPGPPAARLNDVERHRLLDLAWASIRHGLAHGIPCSVDLEALPPLLAAPGAAFVTLHRSGELRGCIGHLEPLQPLAQDVADNAFAAAFRDPRFPPLQGGELSDLELEISVLNPPESILFGNEQELLAQIRPGVDGLILEDGPARGTFLPAVWQSLPDPRQFLEELKRKAGLTRDHWSDTLRVWRYHTESFSA